MIQSQAPATTDVASITQFVDYAHELETAIGRVFLGQAHVMREAVIALLAGGHLLLEGVPGLGKTLLVRTLAASLDLSFSRIQFTPDLMPADITGTTILREDEYGQRSFSFQPGPLFAHVVLADEINRATPKTQSALLEAMQERTVTVGNTTHSLPSTFFVLATQNPLEMEGTYPLPEAQLDRFLFKVVVPFPDATLLRGIAYQTTQPAVHVDPVLNEAQLTTMMQVARGVPIAAALVEYAVALTLATHPLSSPVAAVQSYVHAGASPRGMQALLTGAQVRALLEGRYNVSVDDLRALAHPSLRHRILLNFEGQADGLTPDQLIDQILAGVEVP
ncbi:MAG: MoxR family ATPase [Chloroflexota bacterium]